MLKRSLITVLIIATLITSSFSPIFTPKTEAFWGTVVGIVKGAAKEYFGVENGGWREAVKEAAKSAARAAVRKAIERMVTDTVKWAQSGFEGNPAYVVDPGQYFTNIADGVAGEFIMGSDLGFLCSPFQANIRISLAQQYYEPQPFQCTITGIAGNIEDFYSDFNAGGWDTWFSMTQTPTNNPYGAYLEAKIELDSRIASALNIEQQQLDWNTGFRSWSECVATNPEPWIDNPGTNGELASRVPNPRHVASLPVGECIERGPTRTPGSVIATQLNNALWAPTQTLLTAEDMDALIQAFTTGLLKRYVFGSDGLFNTSAPPPPRIGTPPPASDLESREIDIDGDGTFDGVDYDGDGRLDHCYFGRFDATGTCVGSTGVAETAPPGSGDSGTLPPVDPYNLNERATVESTWASSPNRAGCEGGSGVACHRFVREVASALAASDPRWGLITKQSGQQQCTMDACGPNVQNGYGEDVVAFLPTGAPNSDWFGFDIVAGAGAPGARTDWNGPLPRRAGNNWAPVP